MEENKIPNGYQKIGDLDVNIDDLSKMIINEKAVSPTPTGKKREDKEVILKVGDKSKRISSIMLGYNKRGIQLENGEYVSEDELMAAIKQEIERQSEDVMIISKKTGKRLNDEAIREIFESAIVASGKISVGPGFDSITNANSNRRIITSAKTGKKVSSPVIISRQGIQLPHGEYVNSQEIQKALQEYIVVGPKTIPIPSKEQEPKQAENKNIVVRIVSKYKPRFIKVLCTVALAAILLSGFSFKNEVVKQPINTTAVVEVVQQELSYKIVIEGKTYILNNDSEFVELLEQFEIGKTEYQVEKGDTFSEYGNSGTKKSIGDEFSKEGKEAGYYLINGFAIYDRSGNLLSYVEQFGDESSYNTNLKETTNKLNSFVEQVLKENPNLTIDDLDIKIHFGSDLDNTRLGWVSLEDYIKDGKIVTSYDNTNKEKVSYEGIIENFNTDYITINNGKENVTINVKDSDGNLIKPGSIVIGSDGQQYIVENLNIKEELKSVVNENGEYEQKTVKKIEWNIKNCNLLVGALPITIALAAYLKAKKLNQQAEKEVSHKEFDDETDYEKFKSEFEKKKAKYETKSKFAKLFIKKQDFMQRLTQEQVKQIYDIIRQKYGYNCQIKIIDDQFHIVYPDGSIIELSEEILDQINAIGKDNEYAAHTR